jgi:hypothetical protein
MFPSPHKIRGLHRNDFIIVAKLDALRDVRRGGLWARIRPAKTHEK